MWETRAVISLGQGKSSVRRGMSAKLLFGAHFSCAVCRGSPTFYLLVINLRHRQTRLCCSSFGFESLSIISALSSGGSKVAAANTSTYFVLLIVHFVVAYMICLWKYPVDVFLFLGILYKIAVNKQKCMYVNISYSYSFHK